MHTQVMKQLLLNGGNPHAKTKKGETPVQRVHACVRVCV